MSTRFPSEPKFPGVQVIDVRDGRHPRRAGTLTTPTMLGPWEALKVNEKRGHLAVSAPSPSGNGVGFIDVYDIRSDCRHEGGWSPDGHTYWAAGVPGRLTAIDVRNPSQPQITFLGSTSNSNHGFGPSRHDKRLCMAEVGNFENAFTGGLALGAGDEHDHAHGVNGSDGDGSVVQPNGLKIFDVSDIQARRPLSRIREVGRLYWGDGASGQHAIPIS